MKRSIITICVLILGALSSTAHAATAFLDNFEDANHDGWAATTTGGTGSTGVQLHNSVVGDEYEAYAYHSGDLSHSLSMDFSYSPSSILSFDMQAVAVDAWPAIAWGGVTVSLLNSFNVLLGSASFVNTSDSTWDSNFLIDNTENHFSASMLDWALVAGLAETDPLSTIGLQFWAQGQRRWNGSNYSYSSATVWFDNVSVSAVPIPGVVWLFGSGLLGLVGIARRKKA